jgi:hypothetical protein
MFNLEFPDKVVSYDTFMDDLSSRIVRKIQRAEKDQETVSQRKAYAIFGRANVDRWRREGRIAPCKRPGKVEYCMADLRLLQQTQQDYFKR